jgi:hypothetical protein
LVEKWNPPSRLEIAEIGKKTEGILGVKENTFCLGLLGKTSSRRIEGVKLVAHPYGCLVGRLGRIGGNPSPPIEEDLMKVISLTARDKWMNR